MPASSDISAVSRILASHPHVQGPLNPDPLSGGSTVSVSVVL